MEMTGRDLMEALAKTVRDEQILRQLERLAAGELPAPERQALEQLAEQDPELKAAMALCVPKAPDFHERLAKQALARMNAGAPAESVQPISLSASTALRPARRPWGARWTRWAAPVLAVGAAAVAAFIFWAPGAERSAALPSYEPMVVVSGERTFRAAGAPKTPTLTLKPGDSIELRLRPQTRAHSPVNAWVFVVQGALVQPVELALEVDPSGAVRAQGQVGAWSSNIEQPAELLVAVGSSKPSPAQVRSRDGRWRWMARAFRRTP